MATKLSDELVGTMAPTSGLGAKLKAMDMSKVSDGFTLIPDGTEVEFEIVKVESGKTQKGDDKISLTLVCLTTPYGGAKCWDTVTLLPQTMWKLKSLSKATGLADANGNFTGNTEQDFLKKIVLAEVTVETWENVDRNKIKGGYKPPIGGVSINTTDDSPTF